MNRAIELHDSRIKLVIPDGENTTIELEPAYLHESQGTPGVDSGAGYLQNVHIQLSGSQIHSAAFDLPARINQASIVLSDRMYDNIVNLPLIHVGNIEVNLRTENGEHLKVTARRVMAVLIGERKPLEKFNHGAAP